MSKDAGAEVVIDRLAEMNCAQCGTRIAISELEPFASVECPSCGNQDTVPARFGQFLLLNLVNVGGMGAVYRGRDESLGRLVAIKVMLRKLGENLEFVENFKREAQAAAKLNHPNVAQIYSYGQVQGQPFIVMELVSGHRFDRLIESHPEGLDPALVLRIGVDIAEGLQAADEIGLVHGDIKPENILLDEKRKAKLVDFGIASFQDQVASEGIWGTPYYIAPEKAQGRKSDSRSDIFSLGATLFHALAGKPPFDGETPIDVVKARLTQTAPALDEVRPEVSKSLAQTVGRMLEREPARRHPTYASLLGDLRRNLQELGATPRVGATGRRVIIKKKESAGGLSPSGRLVINKSISGYNQLPRLEEQREVMRVRQRRKAKVVGVVVAVLVLVVAVGALLANRHGRQLREQERRRQVLALEQAVDRVEQQYAAASVTATNIIKLAAEFEPLAASVRPVLRDVEALEPPVAEVVETAPVEPAVPAVEPVAAPPPADQPAAVAVDEAGREAPFGMPSRKAELPRRAIQGDAAAPAPAPTAPAPVPVAEAAPVVVGPAGQIRALVAKLEAWVVQAQETAAQVPRIMKAADAFHEGLATLTSLEDVTTKANALREQQAQLDVLAKELRTQRTEAAAAVEQVRQLAKEVRREAEARRLVEEQRRAEAARQGRIEEELAMTSEAAANGNARIRKAEYDEALRDVAAVGRKLKTDEAKAALAVTTDRYTRLVALQKYLVAQLTQAPFGWGWLRPGSGREDVLGADAKGVKLRGREVPWARVSNAQFLTFVEHYVGQPKVRPSVKGEHYLATAIYCEEFGNTDYAKRYRAKALEASPQLAGEADRLLATD